MKHYGILVPKYTDQFSEQVYTMGMSGHFRIEARAPHRYKGARKLAEFDNLILNSGLARAVVAAPSLIFSGGGVQLGTGTTPPAVTDTTLTAPSKYFTGTGPGATASYVPGPPPYWQYTHVWRANPGEATGTFSEIGVGWNNGANLWSKALIVDGGGSPTTITILADEYLDVYYTLKEYPPTADVTGTTVISGTSYDWVMRSARVGFNSTAAQTFSAYGIASNYLGAGDTIFGAAAALGTIYTSPTGGGATGVGNNTRGFATAGSARRLTTTFPLASGVPTGGVGAVQVFCDSGPALALQQSFTPAIPKTGYTVLTLSYDLTPARYP